MKKKLLFLAFVVVVALSFAPAAHAANPFSQFGDSVRQRWNRIYLMLPGNKSGQTVLDQSLKEMKDLKSFTMGVTTDIKLLNKSDKEMASANFAFSGPMEVKDVYDPNSVKQDLNVKGEVSMQGTSLKGNADVKMDGKTFYFNIHEMPALPFMNFSSLKDQWLKIDAEELNKNTPFEQTEPEELTDEQRQQMQDAFVEMMKESTVSDARKEQLDGVNVFVVDVSISDESLLKYSKKVAEISKKPQTQIDKQSQDLEKTLKAVDPLKLTFKIDRSTFYVRQVEVPVVADMQVLMAMNGTPSTGDEEESEFETMRNMTPFGSIKDFNKLTINFKVSMDKFNMPVTFEVPSDAQDAQEAFQKAAGGPSGAMLPDPDMPPSRRNPQDTSESYRPVERPDLSNQERELLKEYGIEVEDL